MKVVNLPLTLVKFTHKSGVGKTSNKPYDFHTASVIDEESNIFTLNLSDEAASMSGSDVLESMRNVSIIADVEFKPKGFDIGGTIVSFAPAE